MLNFKKYLVTFKMNIFAATFKGKTYPFNSQIKKPQRDMKTFSLHN